LCEQARLDLQALQERIPHKLVVVNVDSDVKLQREYGFEVPVVEVGPYKLRAPFGHQELSMTLAAAQDRERHIEQVEHSPALEEVRRRGVWTRADSFSNWMAHHYMAVFNLGIVFYLGMSFLAPVLMQAGASAPAGVLYKAYSLVCHQLAYRSFFLFGEQPYYPRQAAGVPGVMTFSQATGLSEASTGDALLQARQYVGDEQVGYKIALCQRDVAIYAGILLFGILFSLSGRRLPVLPWYLWLAFGILPIALDGFSQMFSQPPFNFFPYRESTPALRVLTGALFGICTAWFGYPMVEESMIETRRLMADKWQRIHARPTGY
jgi:uncharacterized membrane protein